MMGQSGGRSSNHPSGRGAIARSTPRQRDLVDVPPGAEREPVGADRPRQVLERAVWVALALSLPVAYGLLILWMAAGLGIL